jgi:CheY-like chemotaxis protein
VSRTILLADDSLAIHRVVKLTFEGSGYEVVALASGDEALAEIERRTPAVVLADVHMPGATGYEVARRVKALRPATPVLLLVGTFEPFDPEESEASGADGHLLKPFESGALRERVESLVGGAAEPVAEAVPEPAPAPDAPASQGRPSAGADDDTVPIEPLSAAAERRRADHPERGPEADLGAAGADASPPQPERAAPALDAETIDRIARRVVELLSADSVREIAREVVPRVAEEAVRRRLEELERDVE